MTHAIETRRHGAFRIRGIDRADRGRAIKTLNDAFALDPACTWTWPEAAARRRRFPSFAAALGGLAFDFGTADATDEVDGVAFWIPPSPRRPQILSGSRSLFSSSPLMNGITLSTISGQLANVFPAPLMAW